jgi:pimeloyl-ACP methyl ester carboxylesterase
MRVLLWGLAAAAFLALSARADSRRQEFSDFTTPLPVERGDRLVIGIVGGWERWDNPTRAIRRTAIAIKRRRLPGVHVETVENHSLELAEQLVERAFDFNRNGRLEPGEASQAAVIIYGQSLGGRAALRLSRRLHQWGVPVPLLIAIDSFGRDSYLVPPNVRRAANYFQREHLYIKGAPELRAQDPSKTRILFNRRLTFKGRDEIGAEEHSWLQRFFLDEHARVEYLPEVWEEIERMIVEAAQEPWPNGR